MQNQPEFDSSPELSSGIRILAKRFSACSNPVLTALRKVTKQRLGRPQAVRADEYQTLVSYFDKQNYNVQKYRQQRNESEYFANLVRHIWRTKP